MVLTASVTLPAERGEQHRSNGAVLEQFSHLRARPHFETVRGPSLEGVEWALLYLHNHQLFHTRRQVRPSTAGGPNSMGLAVHSERASQNSP